MQAVRVIASCKAPSFYLETCRLPAAVKGHGNWSVARCWCLCRLLHDEAQPIISVFRQTLLDANGVDKALRACGLSVEHLSTLGDAELVPGRDAYLARMQE